MNAQLTSEIRELTDTELDAVSGGIDAYDVGYFGLMTYFGAMIPATIGALWEWIFGD
jgi:bacteriocin-like protein